MPVAQPGTNTNTQTAKPSRGSLRHSLGLASKAFVDVISKDSKDGSKKEKDGRVNATQVKHNTITSPPSAGIAAQTIASKEAQDSRTVTRKRASIQMERPSADTSKTPGDTISPPTRQLRSGLRPRPSTTGNSTLPKYRPRSAHFIGDPARKPPSPTEPSTKRSSSSSETESSTEPKKKLSTESEEADMIRSPDKPTSAIHRKTMKVNLSNSMKVTPPAPATTQKPSPPTPTKISPKRTTKPPSPAAIAPAAQATQSSIPRHASSSSASSSIDSHTPKKSSLRNALGLSSSPKGRTTPTQQPSPRRVPESPLAGHSRKPTKDMKSEHRKPKRSITPPSTSSNTTEGDGDSDDSFEVVDVEKMLAPSAELSAPTPAMPRIQPARRRARLPPQTPTKELHLPTRANLSYFSPLLPDSDSPSSSLRPPLQNSAPRGSILTWEQFAVDASRTLGEDEIGTLLSDLPSPFISGSGSPTTSIIQLDVPDSPSLSAMPSPGGYGSISQVLLPDVTPSPAPHINTSHRFDQGATSGEAAAVTLLRLQKASLENTAKERLSLVQSLEEENHYLKEEVHRLKSASAQHSEDVSKQLGDLHETMQSKLKIRDQNDQEQAAYIVSLEARLNDADHERERAVQKAAADSSSALRRATTALTKTQQKLSFSCVAQTAACHWSTAHVLAQLELETVAGDREILVALLSELDVTHRRLSAY